MYARVSNDNQVIEYPIINIRSMYPNTSFPAEIKQSDLPPGIVIVNQALDIPVAPEGFKIEEQTPVLVDGKWYRSYGAVNISEEQLEIIRQAKANSIRSQRNQLLAECDWTQFKDIDEATSTLWAPYRQALRDITDQPGFPLSVTWPKKPNALR